MKQTSIIDIISPVMVGPSSSHTAGAVRLGLLAKNIYNEIPDKVVFKLYNSYAQTGKGHGTDKGLLAGVLGLSVDDVQIKDIFDSEISKEFQYEFQFYEDFNRVGSDNVWGDRYSFWYRLMLYLRGLLEEQFGDYSLRKDNVIPGYIQLIREYDFRAYYDSYPFSLSPLSRGILSRVP